MNRVNLRTSTCFSNKHTSSSNHLTPFLSSLGIGTASPERPQGQHLTDRVKRAQALQHLWNEYNFNDEQVTALIPFQKGGWCKSGVAPNTPAISSSSQEVKRVESEESILDVCQVSQEETIGILFDGGRATTRRTTRSISAPFREQAVDAPDSVIDASEDREDQSNNTSSSTENEGVLVKSREGVESRLVPLGRSIGAVKVEQGSLVKDEQQRDQFNSTRSSAENGCPGQELDLCFKSEPSGPEQS
ncbi:hypothetical protein RclHR1_15740006 [Rhizophagus clarus]|uniref:Uncharacterized protein n=1 Tax=Rhizophagus clarus TaxID=94130 RepID=A0A2Z6QG02_9GLOM|nr:hypothetical protein RclHR1_15740006 [Rhizophagus clarus]